VNPSPTKVGFVITRFQLFPFDFPVFKTLNTSSSAIPLTFGNGTLNLAAASFRFCLTILESCFAFFSCARSSRYAGTAPSLGALGSDCLTFRCSCCLICFFIWILATCRLRLCSFALKPVRDWATLLERWASRASFLRLRIRL